MQRYNLVHGRAEEPRAAGGDHAGHGVVDGARLDRGAASARRRTARRGRRRRLHRQVHPAAILAAAQRARSLVYNLEPKQRMPTTTMSCSLAEADAWHATQPSVHQFVLVTC